MQWTFDRVTVEKEKCNEKEDLFGRCHAKYCVSILYMYNNLIWKTKIYAGQVGRHIEISLKHSLWCTIFTETCYQRQFFFPGMAYQLIAIKNHSN